VLHVKDPVPLETLTMRGCAERRQDVEVLHPSGGGRDARAVGDVDLKQPSVSADFVDRALSSRDIAGADVDDQARACDLPSDLFTDAGVGAGHQSGESRHGVKLWRCRCWLSRAAWRV
jgi:hypothetical protein